MRSRAIRRRVPRDIQSSEYDDECAAFSQFPRSATALLTLILRNPKREIAPVDSAITVLVDGGELLLRLGLVVPIIAIELENLSRRDETVSVLVDSVESHLRA